MRAPGGDDLLIRRFEGTRSQDNGGAVCEQCERNGCRVWTLEKETAGLRLGSKEEGAGELSAMCLCCLHCGLIMSTKVANKLCD